jgi:hypothetical protein
MSYKIIEANASGPSEPEPSDATDGGQHSQNVASMDITDVVQCSHHAGASPFLPMIRPIPLAEDSCQWLEHEFSLPLTKVLGGEETQPDQMAISKAKNNTCSHSPMPTAALMPPTNEPVAQLPAYPHCSSPECEMWLRWKPPDLGGSKRWLTCYIVSEKLRLGVITHSPKFSAAFPQPVPMPALPQAQLNHLSRLPSLTLVGNSMVYHPT